jgi:hypothetical protein
MNIYDLTITQLKRAFTIREELSKLGNELRSIFDGSNRSGTPSRKRRTMSASAKRKIATAQKARWAKLRPSKKATRSPKAPPKVTKKSMSPAVRAKLSAKLKAYWAAKKKSGKR